jgi:hypothetical protein
VRQVTQAVTQAESGTDRGILRRARRLVDSALDLTLRIAGEAPKFLLCLTAEISGDADHAIFVHAIVSSLSVS